jgi:hypothetical protein
MRFVFVSEEPGCVQLVVHARYEGARVRKYHDGNHGSEPALGTAVSAFVPFRVRSRLMNTDSLACRYVLYSHTFKWEQSPLGLNVGVIRTIPGGDVLL